MPSNFELSPADWSRLRTLLRQGLDLPPVARAAWLAALPPEMADFRSRLGELLAQAQKVSASGALSTLPRIETADFASAPHLGGLSPEHAPGDSVGPYRLVQLLGQGGMGSVWLAERTDMLKARPIALKLPHLAWQHPGLLERMVREREILAALDHPHIARLYDAGVDARGQPYLALERVEGERIDEYAARLALDVAARLRLFQQVMGAVAHAHAHLVVHRDLKPSNILVGGDGQVKLLDFGIAKLLADDVAGQPDLTQQGGRLLTPAHASPEQIAGRAIGTASDVYALGVVLFGLLTGQHPQQARLGSRSALEQAILDDEPPRPSAVAPAPRRRALRGDLDTIVLKALKKEPAQRYPTVEAMAADIERHLRHEPVLARPDSRLYRLRKLVARHRFGMAAAGAMATAVLVGAALALWQARVAIDERDRAREVRNFIESIFREADPYGGSKGPISVAALLQSAQRRADLELKGRPALRVEMLELIGGSLTNLQEIDAASVALDDAVAVARAELGDAHALTLRTRVARLNLYRFQGKAEAIQAELRELLPLLRQPDADPESLVIALKSQVDIAIDGGRHAEALQVAQESFDFSLRRLGDRHGQTGQAAILLATAHLYMAQPAEAKAAAEQALRTLLHANAGNSQHPDVIAARSVLARALGELGDLRDAVTQFERVIQEASAHFGPMAVEVGFHVLNVARYLGESGEVRRAEQATARGVAIFKALDRADNFFYPGAQVLHGSTLLDLRRPAPALPELLAAVARLQSVLGPAHPRTRNAQEELARAHAMLGQADEAKRALQATASDGPGGAASAPLLHHLMAQSTAARLGGQTERALQIARQALAATAGPREAINRMKVLPLLGLALVDAGVPAQALPVLTEAAQLLDRHQTSPSPERADVHLGLGRARLALGQVAEALPALQSADDFWRGFDADNRWAGEAAYWLAQGLAAAGQPAAARDAQARALPLLARSGIAGDAAWALAPRASQSASRP